MQLALLQLLLSEPNSMEGYKQLSLENLSETFEWRRVADTCNPTRGTPSWNISSVKKLIIASKVYNFDLHTTGITNNHPETKTNYSQALEFCPQWSFVPAQLQFQSALQGSKVSWFIIGSKLPDKCSLSKAPNSLVFDNVMSFFLRLLLFLGPLRLSWKVHIGESVVENILAYQILHERKCAASENNGGEENNN